MIAVMKVLKSKLYYFVMLPFFFPNVGFNIFSFDVSPLPLLAALFILATTSKKYSTTLYVLWIPAFFSVPFILTTFGDWSYFFRLIGVYFTVPLVSMACYKAIEVGVDVGEMAKHAIYISFFGGVAQKFFSIEIFSYLLQSRTTELRGYNSLFVEPSFFGMATMMFCLIHIVSNRISESKYSWLSLGVGFVSVVALSQSALAILILFAAISLSLMVTLSVRSVLLLVLFVALLIIAAMFITDGGDSRIINVMYLLLKNPEDILFMDASISERVMHVYLSIKGSVISFFMPNGFYKFYDLVLVEMSSNEYFWWGEPSNKIMSGIGSALYEIGFVALVTPWIFILLSVRNDLNRGLLMFLIVTPIFIYSNAINFASPYFSVLLGVLASGVKKYKHEPFYRRYDCIRTL